MIETRPFDLFDEMTDEDRQHVLDARQLRRGLDDNGDGLAALMWATGEGFSETLSRVAGDLGLGAERHACDVIQEVAWRKGISAGMLEWKTD